MRITFEAPGQGGEAELRSLHEWLAGDRRLRGGVRVEPVTHHAPGRMGPSLEAVLALVSTASAVAQLPLSYLAWRQARNPSTPVVVAATGPGAEELLRRLGVTPPPAAPDGEDGEDDQHGEDGQDDRHGGGPDEGDGDGRDDGDAGRGGGPEGAP
jgi:hypothetical protein